MTDGGVPSSASKRVEPDAVAPVLTALASRDCRLNGEYIVAGDGRLRRASVVEWGTVPLPDDPDLSRASWKPCWRKVRPASRKSSGSRSRRSTT